MKAAEVLSDIVKAFTDLPEPITWSINGKPHNIEVMKTHNGYIMVLKEVKT